MPSSTWVPISTVIDAVMKTKPKTILDLGIGFGRWGFLCREFCDIFRGRYEKYQWQTTITGVEAYEDYIKKHHKYFYDNIIIGDALETLNYFVAHGKKFDLVIAGDIIEHFPKDQGERFLDRCKDVAIKRLILGVPFGTGYKQGAALGNPYEEHKSVWEEKDFPGAQILTVKERIRQRPYGVVQYVF